MCAGRGAHYHRPMDTIVGTRLGAYLVEKRLGQGGMATVFIGVQPSTGRKVAIKTLPKSQLSDPKAVARFEREAQVLASLQHPHILPLIDYGEAGDYKYLVVPYLAHGDLEDRLQRVLGPLDMAETRRILTQLAEALDHAHAQGIVHRDLKPGNVLLDGQGNAMLADFGIAHLAGSDRLTGVGFTVGTPEYMAPEQVNGHPEARSDLYALGVLAFRLLTGVLPFKGSTATATLLLQRDSPAPDARSVQPGLSTGIAAFLARALAKDMSERYPSGHAFAQAVRAVLPESSPSVGEVTACIPREELEAFVSGSHAHVDPSPNTTQPLEAPEFVEIEVGLDARTQPHVVPAPPSSVVVEEKAALAAAQAALTSSATITTQRPVVRMPAVKLPVVDATPAAATMPLWPWVLAVLLLAAVLGALWWSSRDVDSAVPQIQVPEQLTAASGGAAPLQRVASPDAAPQFKLLDTFSGPLRESRWQAVGGLKAAVSDGRLRLQADRPQQWLRARDLPAFDAVSVQVQLERTRAQPEAAAGITLSRGRWWASCYLYRATGSDELVPRCMENDVVVFDGAPVVDQMHELAMVLTAEGRYRFLLGGRELASIKPLQPLPVEPLNLVLSLWTPRQGAPVTGYFDEVRLASGR